MRTLAHGLACAALVLLALLCVAWEGPLAPLRPGGSLLVLKAAPLLAPLFGLLRERLYTYRWTSLLALAYFAEGTVRAWAEAAPVRPLALAEVVLSLLLFGACLAFVRLDQGPRLAA